MNNIIRFTPKENDWIAYKYPCEFIPLRSQLIVSPGQCAICVYMGKIEGVFNPGISILDNANYPFLGRVIQRNGADCFPFEVYFINTTIHTKSPWFTSRSAYLRDSDTSLLVHIGARGSYIFRLKDPQFMLQVILGEFNADEVIPFSYFKDQFDDEIQEAVQTSLSKLVVTDQIPVLSLSAHTKSLSNEVKKEILEFFAKYGFEIIDFNTTSINVSDEDLIAMKKRKEYDVLGTNHITERQLDISESWSKNEGTAGSSAVGMMGLGIGLNALEINLGQNAVLGKSETKRETIDSSSAKICPKCKNSIPQESKFCPVCGMSLTIICPYCKAKNNPESNYCNECGKRIGG